VDYDLTSGDQQEEVLDPTRSVMLSSQKTEDITDRPTAAGGVPGTASNMPSATQAVSKTGGGVSRRTENITYQTSRVVRHTTIPQGVIRRMSLAVLVDQSVRWEGDGPQKQRVLVPPAPETLKSIRDLVAGVTGLNTDRGDQLIVETLPFESSLNSPPPGPAKPINAPKPSKDPAWLQFLTNFRDLWGPLMLAFSLLLGLAYFLFRAPKRRGPMEHEIRVAEELQAGAASVPLPPAPAFAAAGQIESGGNDQSFTEDRTQLAERVRHLARKDTVATANVLRMWLQESKS
jgi:flagellar M-ring protein FliF